MPVEDKSCSAQARPRGRFPRQICKCKSLDRVHFCCPVSMSTLQRPNSFGTAKQNKEIYILCMSISYIMGLHDSGLEMTTPTTKINLCFPWIWAHHHVGPYLASIGLNLYMIIATCSFLRLLQRRHLIPRIPEENGTRGDTQRWSIPRQKLQLKRIRLH